MLRQVGRWQSESSGQRVYSASETNTTNIANLTNKTQPAALNKECVMINGNESEVRQQRGQVRCYSDRLSSWGERHAARKTHLNIGQHETFLQILKELCRRQSEL